MKDVCYTREIALEKAIEMELKSFSIYKDAYLKSRDRLAKDLLSSFQVSWIRRSFTRASPSPNKDLSRARYCSTLPVCGSTRRRLDAP